LIFTLNIGEYTIQESHDIDNFVLALHYQIGVEITPGKKTSGDLFSERGRKAISTAKDGKLIGGLFAAGEVDFTFQKIMGI